MVDDDVVPGTIRFVMATSSHRNRMQAFGFDTPTPWALPALRLLFSAPRVYQPLAQAWNVRYPGTLSAIHRLVAQGWVESQAPVLVNTLTGTPAASASRRVPRYVLTRAGRLLLADISEDSRVAEVAFPKTEPATMVGVVQLMSALDLRDSHVKYGMSAAHAAALSTLSARAALWWMCHLRAKKLVREIAARYADVREVVPAHFRVTRALCRQLDDVTTAFPATAAGLSASWRLRRTTFLSDIDPVRVGLTGATDFDHDVNAQALLSTLLGSPRFAPGGLFRVEPSYALHLDTNARPWQFTPGGANTLPYQPDAEFREADAGGTRRTLLEYERYQSRRSAWNHVERAMGYLSEHTYPFEDAVLRFVVDTTSRERTYVALIEAFADYALDHPGRIPANSLTLAVSSVPRRAAAADPLGAHAWFHIDVPRGVRSDTERRPVLHPVGSSPYDEYFTRG